MISGWSTVNVCSAYMLVEPVLLIVAGCVHSAAPTGPDVLALYSASVTGWFPSAARFAANVLR